MPDKIEIGDLVLIGNENKRDIGLVISKPAFDGAFDVEWYSDMAIGRYQEETLLQWKRNYLKELSNG